MDWGNFYITVATAAATVLGLLFVAVQFNLEKLPADESEVWLATARSSWIVLAALFLVTLVYLVPPWVGLGRVIGTALVLGISGRRIVAAWLPTRHATGGLTMRSARTLWVMVGPLLLFAVLMAYTVLLARGINVQGGIAYILMGLFALALRNSWDLLVELRLARRTDVPAPEHDPPLTPSGRQE